MDLFPHVPLPIMDLLLPVSLSTINLPPHVPFVHPSEPGNAQTLINEPYANFVHPLPQEGVPTLLNHLPTINTQDFSEVNQFLQHKLSVST